MSEPTPRVPVSPIARSVAQARQQLAALPRPWRIFLVATALSAVLFGGFTMYERVSEPYVPVFAQLDRDDAAAVVAKLKESKVPYRVQGDGTVVEVPESRVRELRLELAGAGLPRGGGVGFESFDKMRMGATDFEQRVLFRRALEGELVRTVGTLSSVESARVHLVLPERSVFVTRSEPASASVVVRLRPGRAVGGSEVGAIVHLVASAVPGLDADRITVVTTEGAMLHRPRAAGADEGGDGDDARALSRSYEISLEDRVRGMLERVVGPGHADVRVTAELDPARVEHTEEHFDPARTVLRSEEQSIERSSGQVEPTVAGVPGAESNLPGGAGKTAGSASAAAPPPPPSASAATALAPTHETHTRNYEVDRVSEKRVTGSGALRRLAVAVVLDGVREGGQLRPRTQEELDKLTLLVRSAAGASDARGDLVTVESMVFNEAPGEPPPEASPAAAPGGRLQLAKRLAPAAAGLAVLLAGVGYLLVRRSRRRAVDVAAPQLAPPVVTAAVPAAPSVVALEGDLRTRALKRAEEDPATAALVVRFWLGTSSAEATDATP